MRILGTKLVVTSIALLIIILSFAPYQALQNDHIKCISAAIQAGVKIALGTDYVGWKDVSANAKEFIHLQNGL